MNRQNNLDLLTEIYTTVKNLADDMQEFKQALSNKADLAVVNEIKEDVKELQKDSKQIHNRWWFASGISTGLAWAINHLLK